ncbi:hypothetical protein K8Q94_01165 [Candidatus Nomurabacteria bacterium]|nr:hypothetical protein [Candidatus Nomurabacteria bacterium]
MKNEEDRKLVPWVLLLLEIACVLATPFNFLAGMSFKNGGHVFVNYLPFIFFVFCLFSLIISILNLYKLKNTTHISYIVLFIFSLAFSILYLFIMFQLFNHYGIHKLFLL